MRVLLIPLLYVTAAAVMVTGCATYNAVTTGSVQGGYILSAAEMNWHCGGLDNALNARVNTIATLSQQAKVNAENMAPTVSGVLARVFGQPGEDDPARAQIKAERAAADAYNASLMAKGCPKVDIDAKLAAAGVGRAV